MELITLFLFVYPEAATRGVLCKKVFQGILENSQENTCARVSFLLKLKAWPATLLTKKTLVQVFSCQFCEISNSTFFTENLWTTASGYRC